MAGEALLVGVLLVALVLGWLAVTGSLETLTPAGRAFFLVNNFTADSLVIALVLGMVAILSLPLRHWTPLAALFSVGPISVALQWFYPLIAQSGIAVRLALGVAVFWATWKLRSWWIVGIVLVPFIIVSAIRSFQVNERFAALNSAPSSTAVSVSSALQEVLLFTVVIVGGLATRRIFEQRAELAERNEELMAERARAAEAAVLDERLRISRELHDVVAHHVTAMTVHAGAARQLITSNADAATDSLRQIEADGRTAVKELHQLLGFLRYTDEKDGNGEDHGSRAPAPSLRYLTDLQDSFGAKLSFTVDVEGDLSNVPSAVDLSAYRIVQEALTNTVKHSTATEAAIALRVQVNVLEVKVVDRGWATVAKTPSGGHGLVGMRERAALHGGELSAGPVEDGKGWQVRAVLPFEGAQ